MSAPPGLDVLRESVRTAVAASSLRSVAEQIGLSHRGLGLFLNGSEPRPATVRKLREWYVRHGAETHAVSEDTVATALALLFDEVPENVRERATAEVLDVVRRAYREAGMKPPKWAK
ncbi:MAG TPA: hypothetical protein VFX98_11695 [Longimicrobiaceae bacterium]|nr:hypothetical protein [Longimicrobiaceae bacterium]